ncbi:5'-nucleotidase C-terminal domain-containing protein [Mitsuaria sp. WAJ17]|uniref:bifunctional metallophosphatase/5'-nucleotidase n=1 Tax=Mitsuaria sp. WAJ17 TaxID=2761452 RepID=UPI0016004FD2|nr:bifunctional metallophosphatase/5'-nucleotidase [Mitsuaria sp. WAJ17]MBB2486301.1 5'-nucleotidase C-terminal domain-containing protein [Mitsuaria sp. WAJ17]
MIAPAALQGSRPASLCLSWRPTLAAALVALVLAACSTAPQQSPAAKASTPASDLVPLRILAINDFHGNLKPPAGGIRIRDPKQPDAFIDVDAGGSEYLATAVTQARAGHANHVFVAAGDLVGGSPLLSALFNDEPAIESLSAMGLALSSVGNHEFDAGLDELQRRQHGGCHPEKGCQGPTPFKGAAFQYLAASTIATATGKPIFPAYAIRHFDGIPVAFIGLTLKGTPGIVVPSSVKGLRFDDEAETVNRLVPQLRAQGVEAIVVLIHEGGFPAGDYNECPGISGPIVNIVKQLDPAVDLVVSGHTHRAYNCRIAGRLVTSGDKYGTIVTAIDVQLDRKTRDIVGTSAENRIVRHDQFARDATQTALIAGYESKATAIIDRPVGRIGASFTREEDAAGATTMGQLVADAHWSATRAPEDGGADFAITNIGGVRSSLLFSGDGSVSFGQVYTTQPFNNNLVVMQLTGAQLKEALEQQWIGQPKFRPLQLSEGLRYAYDATRPVGDRVLPGSLQLRGQPLRMEASYKVGLNMFLAAGGDGFPAFAQGKILQRSVVDHEALVNYLQAHPGLKPAPRDRVQAR